MQRVDKSMLKNKMFNVPFEHRAELFKNAVERVAKRFMVELTCGYIKSYHDYNVVISDKVNDKNNVYYNTLTQEE